MSGNFGPCGDLITCNGMFVSGKRVINPSGQFLGSVSNSAVTTSKLNVKSSASVCGRLAVECLGAKASDTIGNIDASVVEELSLGNGNDGEAIAFNPDNCLLYHASGWAGGPQFFETVHPTTLDVSSNLVSGDLYPDGLEGEEITGIAWYPGSKSFLVIGFQDILFSLSADGSSATEVGMVGAGETVRGFGVVGNKLYGASPHSGMFFRINADTGRLMSKKQAKLSDGTVIPGINGVASCPGTDQLYVIYKNPDDEQGDRFLGTINKNTAVVTFIKDLGEKMAGLVFDSTGKLWLVTGDGGSNSETLFSITDDALCPEIALKSSVNAGCCNIKNVNVLCSKTATFDEVPGPFATDTDAGNAGLQPGQMYFGFDVSGRAVLCIKLTPP